MDFLTLIHTLSTGVRANRAEATGFLLLHNIFRSHRSVPPAHDQIVPEILKHQLWVAKLKGLEEPTVPQVDAVPAKALIRGQLDLGRRMRHVQLLFTGNKEVFIFLLSLSEYRACKG